MYIFCFFFFFMMNKKVETMTDIGACMYKRIYVHIQGLGDEKGVQHLSRKGRDRLLVRRQPRRGVDPVSFEVPLVADESRLYVFVKQRQFNKD
jgi:hypothetical protein